MIITGYEEINNEITNGGRGLTISIIHVRKMVKADKYTFKRVYMEDRTYYYPRISENNLLKKKISIEKYASLKDHTTGNRKIQRYLFSLCIR